MACLSLHSQYPLRQNVSALEVKVNVVLGVMSRCPDALLCESVFDEVLKHVSHKVDLSLTYLAK
jgi:hypothetical protein